MTILDSRIHSLTRRADSLPQEIDQWLSYADEGEQFEKNSSQLQALDLFMGQISHRLQQDVSQLTRLANLTPFHTEDVLAQAELVEKGISKAHYIWAYFRGKLEQRFVPQFAHALLIADLVSYDCYRTVMNNADRLGIKHKLLLRDYPLTYFLEDCPSPVTWPRTVKLRRLDHRKLPVPIIGLPWDHTAIPWELLSLHHEVSHDIDADLNEPSPEIGLCLEGKLRERGIPQGRVNVWRKWMGEIFADFLGILLAGPPFVSFLAGFMTRKVRTVCSFAANTVHPTPYLRTLLNGEFVRHILGDNTAQSYITELMAQWEEVYGKPSPDIAAYLEDFETVIETFLSSQLQALKNSNGTLHTISELIDFGEEQWHNQLAASECFLSNQEITLNIPLRHIIGAAYMAVEKQPLDDSFANRVLEQMNRSIELKAPKGQLALRTEQSKQHLQELANSYFDNTLHLQGGFEDETIR